MTDYPDLKEKFFSLKTLASFLLAFVIIYLLVTKMDAARVWEGVRNTGLAVYILGFAVYYLAFPLRGLRFKIMLQNNGCPAPAGDLTRIILISWFANCLVPAKLGDVFRAYLVRRKYGRFMAKTIGTIFAERVFDLFILCLLIGGSGLVAFQGRIPDSMMAVVWAGFILLAAVLAVLVVLKSSGARLVDRLPPKAAEIYRRFSAGTLSAFRHNGQIAALTTLIWLLEGTSFYLVARAVGLHLSFPAVLFTGLASALLTALPATPAGLGVVEAAKVGILLLFRVDRSMAVTAALLDRLINYWSLLLVGFIVYLLTEQGRLAKEGEADEGNGRHSYL